MFFQLVILLAGVGFLTPDGAFARSRCEGVFQSAPEPTLASKAIDFVWLLHAPTKEEDKVYVTQVAEGRRGKNPMPGGHRGLGIGEEAVDFAYRNVVPLLSSALSRHQDRFTTEERSILAKIIGVAHLQPEVIFVSEQDKPGFFDLSHEEEPASHRLAKTGDYPGAPIYVNASQLRAYASMNGSRFQVGFDIGEVKRFAHVDHIAQMFGLIVHELGHHLGIKDSKDRPLDVLAAKVTRLVQDTTGFHSLEDHGLPYIAFLKTGFEPPSPTAQSGRIGAVLPEHLFDFTDSTRLQLEKTFGQPVDGVWLQSLRWEPVGQWDMATQAQPFVATGDLVFRTKDGELYQVPTRWMMMVSHPGQLENAYARRANWSGSFGFVITGPYERQVGLQIFKERVAKFDGKPAPIPAEIASIRTSGDTNAGATWMGEIEFRLSENLKVKQAQVVLGSDELAYGSYFKPYRFMAQHSGMESSGDRFIVRFAHNFPAATVERKVQVVKVILTYENGRVEEVKPPQRQVIQVKGARRDAGLKGVGVAPTEKIIKVEADFIPVKEQIQRYLVRSPINMKLPLYVEVDGLGDLARAEILGVLHYRATDGRVKNVNFVLDLLDPRHPVLKEARIENLPDGKKRVHFAVMLPSEFAGRPVERLTLYQLHLIDKNLQEILDPLQISIQPLSP